MKLSITFIFSLYFSCIAAQPCGTLSSNFESDFCWLKNFMKFQLEISDDTAKKFQTYNYGKSSYTLSGTESPWGGNYFCWKNGGLATRWRAFVSEKIYPHSSELDSIKVNELTTDDIARLSPAEKLDIYLGYYDFKITKHELKNRGPETPNIYYWEGFCNGVRAAGGLTPEPIKPDTVKNQFGKTIIFYPTDIKILLGASYFYLEDFSYGRLGKNNSVAPNAGVFDILIRLLIGNKRKVVFFDDNQSEQIWNHSIIGYTRTITENIRKAMPGEIFPNNANRIISYKVILYHMGETSIEDMNGPTKFRISNLSTCCVTEEVYHYSVYIDANNKIVDGKWKDNLYPDTIWFANGKGEDENHTSSIGNDPNTGRPYRGNQYLSYEKILKLAIDASR